MTLGVTFFLTITTPMPEKLDKVRTHRFVVNLGTDGQHYLHQHTFNDEEDTLSAKTQQALEVGTDSSVTSKKTRKPLDILCYNIWNTNPPAWLIHDGSRRNGWYTARMDYFAEVILEAQAPIVALQEVSGRVSKSVSEWASEWVSGGVSE